MGYIEARDAAIHCAHAAEAFIAQVPRFWSVPGTDWDAAVEIPADQVSRDRFSDIDMQREVAQLAEAAGDVDEAIAAWEAAGGDELLDAIEAANAGKIDQLRADHAYAIPALVIATTAHALAVRVALATQREYKAFTDELDPHLIKASGEDPSTATRIALARLNDRVRRFAPFETITAMMAIGVESAVARGWAPPATKPMAAAATSTPAGAELTDWVTLDQAAAVVGQSKRTLERYVADEKLPQPDLRHGNGRAHLWRWDTIRPALEKHFVPDLPAKFPASRIV